MKEKLILQLLILLLLVLPGFARAHGTAFAFQGHLTDGGGPANGSYDLTFSLFDDPGAGRHSFLPALKTLNISYFQTRHYRISETITDIFRN